MQSRIESEMMTWERHGHVQVLGCAHLRIQLLIKDDVLHSMMNLSVMLVFMQFETAPTQHKASLTLKLSHR